MKKRFLVVAFIVIVVFILSLGCFLAKRGFLSRSTSVFVKAWLGSAKAQYKLGMMYYYGFGVPQDYKKAFEWFSKAAKQGNADAQYSLGWMYEKGVGVPKDYVQAYKWYKLTAAHGDEDADKALDTLESKMSAEQIAEAQRLSREFVTKK